MNKLLTVKSEVPSSGLPQKNNYFNQLLVLTYGLVAVLALGNLIGTNTLATQGVILDDITGRTLGLVKENHELEVEISHLSNLSYLETLAESYGFSRIRTPITLNTNETVAAAVR